MLSVRMDRMMIREMPGPISMPKNVSSNSLTPMNAKSMPNPMGSRQNMPITLLSMKKRERSPKMAKILEKNTI